MNFKRYESRFEAGQILAKSTLKELDKYKEKIELNRQTAIVFAIPNGGVPVAEGFCSILNLNYDIIIVRKIKIPYNPEAGFGAITTDGSVLLNELLLEGLHLSKEDIERSIDITKSEIEERLKIYGKTKDLKEKYQILVKDKYIFLIDDGLASGFTMLSAIKMLKNYLPKKIFVAIPTAPLRTVKRVKDYVDDVFCPNIRNVWHFAVADAYKHWYDVPESEVLEILKKSSYYIK
ncbi:MAG: phosphoribosyltransferase [Promethearchaeia archaeon]